MSDDYVSLEHREAQVAELEAEIERLRAALRQIAVCHEMRVMRDIARAALEGK